jgi:tetratricopeptide (TPR) repeat protein
MATSYLEQAVAIDPALYRALFHLADMYKENGLKERLLSVSERAVDVHPSKETLVLLADTYMHLNRFSDAHEVLQRAHELSPDDVDVVLAMADLFSFQDQYAKAEIEIRKASAFRSPEGRVSAGQYLASLCTYSGRYREAIRLSESGIRAAIHAGDTTAWAMRVMLRGWTFWAGWNDLDRAWLEVQKTFPLQNSINFSVYWGHLASLYAMRGEHDLAADLLVRKVRTNDPLRGYFQTLVYAETECSKAEASFDRVRAALPPFSRVWAYYKLGRCQFAQGELDKAVNSLTAIHSILDNTVGIRAFFYPKTFYLLGRIYERKGDIPAAIRNYEKLLTLWKEGDKDLFELTDAKARLLWLRSVARK